VGFLLALLLCCSIARADSKTFTVGSKRFAESDILGEIVVQTANKVGEAKTVHQSDLGNTGIVYAALTHGDIDLYPEYTGTIALELLKLKTTPDIATLNRDLAPQGLAVGVPLGFNDGYALAMREDQAKQLSIANISDLSKHPDLRLGISQEFLNRADGWPGLKTAYGLPFTTPQGLDHGAAYAAIHDDQVDVIDIYSTDSQIKKYHLRVLNDDRKYFPSYDAVLIYRADLPQRFPKTWAALQGLQNTISADKMIAMNAQVEIDKQSSQAVAASFLSGGTLKTVKRSFWTVLFGPDFLLLTGQHLYLVFVSLLLSIIVGVPLGIAAARNARAAGPILSVVSLIQTIPSLALLAFLIPFLSIGAKPAIVALFLYSLLPIVRNTYTGLTDIARPLRESAIALGLTSGARLRLVELPLAARTIFAGIKTAAIINVGTATIAAFIGAGGYGERIQSGLGTLDNDQILAGAVPAAALALLVQVAFDLLDKAVVPEGLRHTQTE
jgi:osmoprotectant transport system permease protein